MKTLYVPQYEGLAIKDILEFVSDKPQVEYYLPEDIDLPKIPKQFIIDICATVLGDQFHIWIRDQIEERNRAMVE